MPLDIYFHAGPALFFRAPAINFQPDSLLLIASKQKKRNKKHVLRP